jgi:predicted AAA+ superfamily ATPase
MNYIKRDLEEIIVPKLNNPKALFILGPRQVGKTTILRKLQQVVGEDNSLYYDMEFSDNLALFSSPIDDIIIRLRFDRKDSANKCYVFLDEIQYIEDFSKKVKLLCDHYSDEFKLILTGSSAALIKYQFKESLVGRKELFNLYPLNFKEFCRFKKEDKIAESLENVKLEIKNPLLHISSKMESLMSEYIIFGGYPEVVLKDTPKEKIDLLNEIVTSYVIKDIRHMFQIEKIEQLNRLINYFAANIGKELNISKLSTSIGIHRVTLQRYIDILRESYIIATIQPFYGNQTRELRKMPKVYLLDTGLRNMLIKNFTELKINQDKGELVENIVFNLIYFSKKSNQSIHYWKTKSQQEIDFVIREDEKITAIEVKYGENKPKHFTAFLNAYPEATCYTARFKYQYKSNENPLWIY